MLIFIVILLIIITYYILKKKEHFSNYLPDTGLLNNEKKMEIYPKIYFRNNRELYLPKHEIEIEKMQNILNKIKKKNKYNYRLKKLRKYCYSYYPKMSKKVISIKQYDFIKKFILDKVNNQILIYKLNKGLGNGFFFILESNILKISKTPDNKYIEYKLLIILYRKYKDYGYQIEFTVFFDKLLNKYYITDANIYGVISEDNIKTLDGYKKENYNIYSDFLKSEYNTNNGYYINNTKIHIPTNKSILIPYLENKIRNIKLNKIEDSYRCYNGEKNANYFDCVSGKDSLYRKIKKGVWDRPCKKDNECPFFMKNKNYPNKRGGCIGGQCEMPVNIHQRSSHSYDSKISKPYCYNCINETNRCCEDQKNKKLYKNLMSPDYVFKGDKFDRYKYRKHLEKKGLQWYDLPEGD